MSTNEALPAQAVEPRMAGKSRMEIKEILGLRSNWKLTELLQGVPPPDSLLRARAKDQLHQQARELRAQGWTYKEIAAELGVSKASISLWVRDLPRRERLSYEECRRRNAEGTRRYWAAERTRREAIRRGFSETAAAEIGELTDREILIAGAVAYWCD